MYGQWLHDYWMTLERCYMEDNPCYHGVKNFTLKKAKSLTNIHGHYIKPMGAWERYLILYGENKQRKQNPQPHFSLELKEGDGSILTQDTTEPELMRVLRVRTEELLNYRV